MGKFQCFKFGQWQQSAERYLLNIMDHFKMNDNEVYLEWTFFFSSSLRVPSQALPQRITVFHFNLFFASSTLTLTTCLSSFTASINLLPGRSVSRFSYQCLHCPSFRQICLNQLVWLALCHKQTSQWQMIVISAIISRSTPIFFTRIKSNV